MIRYSTKIISYTLYIRRHARVQKSCPRGTTLSTFFLFVFFCCCFFVFLLLFFFFLLFLVDDGGVNPNTTKRRLVSARKQTPLAGPIIAGPMVAQH